MERDLDCLAQLVWMQPLGERIDRIDQRQLGKAGCIHHTVGMHHLQMAVVERRDAGNVAGLALAKEFLQIIPARIEIGDGQRVGVVAGLDVVGRAGPVRRWRPVAIDGDRHGDNGIGRDGRKLWLIAPVDEAGRQMKQQIDNAWRLVVAPDQPGEQFLQLRPDTGQRRERREQRIEHCGAHQSFILRSVTLRCERSEPRRATAPAPQPHPSRAAARPPQDDGELALTFEPAPSI